MSTVEEIYQSLLKTLLRGEHAPGTWLRQDDLAAQLGVSKIPVREALQRLAASGLLSFKPQRGVVVPSLSAADAEEVFQLRLTIEPMLLERSVSRLSVVDLAQAELALTRVDLPVSEANWAFHRALYQASGWLRGMAIAEILHASVAPYVVLYTVDLGAANNSDAQHRALLKHCREGQSQAACEVLTEHIQQAANALVGFLNRSLQAAT